jgi:hypothetical protein
VSEDKGPTEDYIGTVGETANACLENDSVRIHVTFSAPAYAYLIALHPSGQVQRYYPKNDDIAPPLVVQITYPEQKVEGEPDSQYNSPLTDGTGLQAFVLVASSQQLPPYRDWFKDLEHSLPWQPSEPDDPGVWRFDPPSSFTRRDTPPKVRSEPRKSATDAPLAFVKTCKALAGRPEVKAIQAWAFPVQKRPDEKQTEP